MLLSRCVNHQHVHAIEMSVLCYERCNNTPHIERPRRGADTFATLFGRCKVHLRRCWREPAVGRQGRRSGLASPRSCDALSNSANTALVGRERKRDPHEAHKTSPHQIGMISARQVRQESSSKPSRLAPHHLNQETIYHPCCSDSNPLPRRT